MIIQDEEYVKVDVTEILQTDGTRSWFRITVMRLREEEWHFKTIKISPSTADRLADFIDDSRRANLEA